MSSIALRSNFEIKARVVTVIGSEGQNFGVMSVRDAQQKADEAGLDLVEVEPHKDPPVCKIMDFGKFRYNRSRRDKESRSVQHSTKMKEVKLRPNITAHDLGTKSKKAREFLEKGHKVRVTCMFRARELAHSEIGTVAVQSFCDSLSDISVIDSPMCLTGRILCVGLSADARKKKPVPPKSDHTSSKTVSPFETINSSDDSGSVT